MDQGWLIRREQVYASTQSVLKSILNEMAANGRFAAQKKKMAFLRRKLKWLNGLTAAQENGSCPIAKQLLLLLSCEAAIKDKFSLLDVLQNVRIS
jgi:hypothetical protein